MRVFRDACAPVVARFSGRAPRSWRNGPPLIAARSHTATALWQIPPREALFRVIRYVGWFTRLINNGCLHPTGLGNVFRNSCHRFDRITAVCLGEPPPRLSVLNFVRQLLSWASQKRKMALVEWTRFSSTNDCAGARIGLATLEDSCMSIDQSSHLELQLDAVCDQFEAAWKAEQRPNIQDHVNDWCGADVPSLLHELLVIELTYRTMRGESPSRVEYEAAFPQYTQVIAFAFAEVGTSPGQQAVIGQQGGSSDAPRAGTETPSGRSTTNGNDVQPTQIDRYRILELLGVGGFGKVYLGYDDQLRRKVAIKVPRMDRVDKPESFLTEAQILASLDHPNIVDVYDAGQTSDGNCYIVSKWIEGTDLAQVASEERLPHRRAAKLVAKIADALQYAHGQKLIHRDIKPANILMDSRGEPYVADFGLALSEDAFGRAGTAGGTAAYMSPEQARGEGHLVDGRSDIFSLAIVLYELLTGERPFVAASRRELLERIKFQDVRPPRQLAGDIPQELERICLKALAKRATDRYSTAMDFGDDLRHFLDGSLSTISESPVPIPDRPPEQPIKVVPKGLRSFDQVDADFFLELLPGPRDRRGLPESIRFWKSRVDQRDGDVTFRVGVIYGPSGCGKSSLVKAGLLPRLADHVRCIYLVSNGDDDEQRLLRSLRKQHPRLPSHLDLVDTMTAIRRGRDISSGTKTLIVLDQFEQWLHINARHERSQLASALRQCDGERLQCILLARDDFWMAVSRFMGQLEVPLIEGENSAAVDLFDPLHAEKVLWVFGQAYGRLPDSPSLTLEQESFLRRAIVSLARDDKVIPVRLAVFAEMMKSRPWTLTELKSFGATQVMMMGVTKTFLEQTFSSETAPAGHRKHRHAAQAVLGALLPDGLAKIKGHMRSRAELLAASEYQDNPRAFSDLMHILDTETRLITPVEPEPATENNGRAATITGDQKYYHLTHDYLVQPLREWLAGKQRETRSGRAELMLAERSHLWNSRPESKQLPSLWEWLKIRLLVKRSRWTLPQSNMMRAASRLHIKQFVLSLLLAAIVGAILWGFRDGIVPYRVNQARVAWRTGLVDETVRLLTKLPNRNHPAVHQFLEEIRNEGGVTFRFPEDGFEIEIHEDRATDQMLELDGLGFDPQVRSPGNTAAGGKARFRAGEHIRLAVGHYRVRVYADATTMLADFPLFIDRIKPNGQQSLQANNEPTPDLVTFERAQQLQITLDIPRDIPDGFVYVNPGPMWHGPDPQTIPITDVDHIDDPSAEEGSKRVVQVHDGTAESSLQRGYLARGFIMARAETTVTDFRRWWARHGADYCAWRTGIYSRVPEAIAETAGCVPLNVQQDCWRTKLEQAGLNVNNLEEDQILNLALHDVRAAASSIWQSRKEEMDRALDREINGNLPVSVSWEIAVAYARTHANINPGQFTAWVQARISEAKAYASELQQLQHDIQKGGDEFIDPDSLPGVPLVRDLLGRVEANQYRRPVLDAYDYWLKVRTYYGYQVPIPRVLAVAKNGTESNLRDESWLWDKTNTQNIRSAEPWAPRDLVDSYADAISAKKEHIDRKHFLRWLEWMIGQEELEQTTYGDLFDQLNTSVDDAIDNLPFAIRYRYGMHLGWDIPYWKEWEKAFRGADARAYPWGNAFGEQRAQLNRWTSEESGPLTVSGATSALNDSSPYGISHMAGNLSEWVRVVEPFKKKSIGNSYCWVPADGNTVANASHPKTVFLKGGNWVLADRFANAGFSLSLSKFEVGETRTAWSGFRVIRRIGDGDSAPAAMMDDQTDSK